MDKLSFAKKAAILVLSLGILMQIAVAQGIWIELEYGNNPNYDPDNDGIETMNGVIDFTVEDSFFNSTLNETNLCTRWEVSSQNESTIKR